MATIDSLAVETLGRVLGLLRVPVSHHDREDEYKSWANTSLLSAALVCRRWAPVAQRELWADMRVYLRPQHDFTERNAKLEEFPVQSLSIQASKDFVQNYGDFQPGTLEDVLGPVVRLTSFVIMDPAGLIRATVPAENFRHPSLTAQRHLSLSSPEGIQADPLNTAFDFVFRLSSIYLWIDCEMDNIVSMDFLRALFTGALHDTLTQLWLGFSTSESTSEGLGLLFTLVSSNIETLALEYDNADLLPLSLADFTALRHLEIRPYEATVNEDSSSEEAPSPLAILKTLPSSASLTHLTLALTNCQWSVEAVDRMLDALVSPAFGSIERISLTHLSKLEIEGEEGGRALSEECERWGIRFECRDV